MKAAVLVLLSFLCLQVAVYSQVPSARDVVRRATPKDQRTPPPEQAPPANTPPQAGQANTRPTPPPVRPKTDAEKQEIEKKTVEFQMKRAQEGSASAQYDLGIRYLNGQGVEKNEETARQWLNAAAQQGNSAAAKKIEELNRKQ
ncbi:MAG: hypothetical protein ACK4UN_02080 [Limisphaerales bacterium]